MLLTPHPVCFSSPHLAQSVRTLVGVPGQEECCFTNKWPGGFGQQLKASGHKVELLVPIRGVAVGSTLRLRSARPAFAGPSTTAWGLGCSCWIENYSREPQSWKNVPHLLLDCRVDPPACPAVVVRPPKASGETKDTKCSTAVMNPLRSADGTRHKFGNSPGSCTTVPSSPRERSQTNRGRRMGTEVHSHRRRLPDKAGRTCIGVTASLLSLSCSDLGQRLRHEAAQTQSNLRAKCQVPQGIPEIIGEHMPAADCTPQSTPGHRPAELFVQEDASRNHEGTDLPAPMTAYTQLR